jgi:hypothetical protein
MPFLAVGIKRHWKKKIVMGPREVGVLRQEREIVKKAISIFSRGQGYAYQFVAEHQQEYPITLMCQVLEISVSGF